MEPLSEALRLVKRQLHLESGMRQFGGISIAEERELFHVRDQLKQYQGAVHAILDTAAHLHRPANALTVSGIEKIAASLGQQACA